MNKQPLIFLILFSSSALALVPDLSSDVDRKPMSYYATYEPELQLLLFSECSAWEMMVFPFTLYCVYDFLFDNIALHLTYDPLSDTQREYTGAGKGVLADLTQASQVLSQLMDGIYNVNPEALWRAWSSGERCTNDILSLRRDFLSKNNLTFLEIPLREELLFTYNRFSEPEYNPCEYEFDPLEPALQVTASSSCFTYVDNIFLIPYDRSECIPDVTYCTQDAFEGLPEPYAQDYRIIFGSGNLFEGWLMSQYVRDTFFTASKPAEGYLVVIMGDAVTVLNHSLIAFGNSYSNLYKHLVFRELADQKYPSCVDIQSFYPSLFEATRITDLYGFSILMMEESVDEAIKSTTGLNEVLQEDIREAEKANITAYLSQDFLDFIALGDVQEEPDILGDDFIGDYFSLRTQANECINSIQEVKWLDHGDPTTSDYAGFNELMDGLIGDEGFATRMLQLHVEFVNQIEDIGIQYRNRTRAYDGNLSLYYDEWEAIMADEPELVTVDVIRDIQMFYAIFQLTANASNDISQLPDESRYLVEQAEGDLETATRLYLLVFEGKGNTPAYGINDWGSKITYHSKQAVRKLTQAREILRHVNSSLNNLSYAYPDKLREQIAKYMSAAKEFPGYNSGFIDDLVSINESLSRLLASPDKSRGAKLAEYANLSRRVLGLSDLNDPGEFKGAMEEELSSRLSNASMLLGMAEQEEPLDIFIPEYRLLYKKLDEYFSQYKNPQVYGYDFQGMERRILGGLKAFLYGDNFEGQPYLGILNLAKRWLWEDGLKGKYTQALVFFDFMEQARLRLPELEEMWNEFDALEKDHVEFKIYFSEGELNIRSALGKIDNEIRPLYVEEIPAFIKKYSKNISNNISFFTYEDPEFGLPEVIVLGEKNPLTVTFNFPSEYSEMTSILEVSKRGIMIPFDVLGEYQPEGAILYEAPEGCTAKTLVEEESMINLSCIPLGKTLKIRYNATIGSVWGPFEEASASEVDEGRSWTMAEYSFSLNHPENQTVLASLTIQGGWSNEDNMHVTDESGFADLRPNITLGENNATLLLTFHTEENTRSEVFASFRKDDTIALWTNHSFEEDAGNRTKVRETVTIKNRLHSTLGNITVAYKPKGNIKITKSPPSILITDLSASAKKSLLWEFTTDNPSYLAGTWLYRLRSRLPYLENRTYSILPNLQSPYTSRFVSLRNDLNDAWDDYTNDPEKGDLEEASEIRTRFEILDSDITLILSYQDEIERDTKAYISTRASLQEIRNLISLLKGTTLGAGTALSKVNSSLYYSEVYYNSSLLFHLQGFIENETASLRKARGTVEEGYYDSKLWLENSLPLLCAPFRADQELYSMLNSSLRETVDSCDSIIDNILSDLSDTSSLLSLASLSGISEQNNELRSQFTQRFIRETFSQVNALSGLISELSGMYAQIIYSLEVREEHFSGIPRESEFNTWLNSSYIIDSFNSSNLSAIHSELSSLNLSLDGIRSDLEEVETAYDGGDINASYALISEYSLSSRKDKLNDSLSSLKTTLTSVTTEVKSKANDSLEIALMDVELAGRDPAVDSEEIIELANRSVSLYSQNRLVSSACLSEFVRTEFRKIPHIAPGPEPEDYTWLLFVGLLGVVSAFTLAMRDKIYTKKRKGAKRKKTAPAREKHPEFTTAYDMSKLSEKERKRKMKKFLK